MADREHKGMVARWLEGKERDEEYARNSLPTSRWGLFWDILKGRLGRLMLTNLLIFVTFLPLIAVLVWRYLDIFARGMTGPYASGLGVGYPVIPDVTGVAESMLLQSDLLFFGLLIPAAVIAGLGISGGAYIIRNLIWTEGVFVAYDFWRGIKRNFWNVCEAVVVFTVVLFMARLMGNLADLYVATGASAAGWLLASKVVGYIFVAFFLLVALWMISLGINYYQGPWALLRNAVIMTIGTFPQTVFFAAVASWPIFLTIFGGQIFSVIGIILMLLLGFSYFFLVWMDFSQWAFDRFVNPNLGVAVGRGLYNRDRKAQDGKPAVQSVQDLQQSSAAVQEYQRLIIAQGKSRLVSRPIKPIDDGFEVYQLPESFNRDDLRKLRENKQAMEEDVKQYEEEHKNEERYVEYNRQFEEREKALQEVNKKGKKKPPKPPKMLNRH